MLLKYNPRKITGSYTGSIGDRQFSVKFEGYMDGTFVEAEFDEDHVTKHVGGDGVTSAVLSANRGATIVVTFVQGAPVNEELSKLVPDGRKNYLPVGTVKIEDLNGTTAINAAEAWIKKTAKVEFGKDILGRQWTFDTGEADINVGLASDF